MALDSIVHRSWTARLCLTSILGLGAALSGACAGDTTTQISDLQEDELSNLCGDHRLTWEPTAQEWCSFAAVRAHPEDPAACATDRDACIDSFPEGLLWWSDSCGEPRGGFPAACEARVALYTECTSFLHEMLLSHLRYDFDCEQLYTPIAAWPASCELFEDSCPGHLESIYGEFFSVSP